MAFNGKLLKRFNRTELGDVVHSSGMARAQSAGGLGAASAQSFSERRRIEQNRETVGKYAQSKVATGGNMAMGAQEFEAIQEARRTERDQRFGRAESELSRREETAQRFSGERWRQSTAGAHEDNGRRFSGTGVARGASGGKDGFGAGTRTGFSGTSSSGATTGGQDGFTPNFEAYRGSVSGAASKTGAGGTSTASRGASSFSGTARGASTSRAPMPPRRSTAGISGPKPRIGGFGR